MNLNGLQGLFGTWDKTLRRKKASLVSAKPSKASRHKLSQLSLETLEGRITPAVTITRTSAQVFYTDNSPPAGAPQMRGNYATFIVTNTGATIDDAWATIGNFTAATGQPLLGLGTYSPGTVSLGRMETGASKLAAFYVVENDTGVSVVGTSGSTITQSYTVSVYDDGPTGTMVGTSNFSFANYNWPGGGGFDKAITDDIKASANKVNSVSFSPNPSVLGGTFTMVVQGDTGTIGTSKVLAFSPAAYLSWRPDAFQLINTSIVFSGGNTGTYTNQLLISAANPASTAYTASYTFRAIGTTTTSTSVNPTAFIGSGTQNKHTDPNSFANLPPILPPVNTMLVSKTVDSSLIASSGQVTYSLTITNSSTTQTASFDRFVDVLPSTPGVVTYVPGSTKLNGVTDEDPVISGQTLTWYNSWTSAYSIPPSSSITLSYKALIPSNIGTYVNSAYAMAGTTQIDTTPSTTDNKPATASVQLAPITDLGVIKTDNVSGALVPGGSVTYTITVSNAGPSSAIGASIVDTLPAGITGATVSSVVTTGGAVITSSNYTGGNINDVATIPSGATIVYTVTGTVSPSATGSVNNTVTVTAPAGYVDPDPSNNTDTNVLGNASADLAITKSDGGTTAIPGTNTTYTITVSNAGPSSVTGAEVTDVLPAGVTFVSATNGAVYNSANRTVSFTTPSIAVNGSTSFNLVVALSPTLTGTLSNTATVAVPQGFTDPDLNNNTSTDTNTLVPTADLVIVKDDSSFTAVPGNEITYTISVTNKGPSTMTGASVEDTLPTGLTFVSATGGASYNSNTRTVSLTTGTLVTGQTTTFQITALMAASLTGSLSNTATVAPPSGVTDPDYTNNTSTDTNTLVPTGDLAITKTDNSSSVVPGNTVTYTITVSNSGPSHVAGAAINDAIPATILNPNWTAIYSTGSSGAASGTGSLSNVLVNLLANGTATFTVTGTVDPTASGTLVNTATVTAPAGFTDPDNTNDSDTDTNTLVPTGDLSITKTDGSGTAVPGSNITYTITVANSGPSTVTGATVTDVLPAGTSFVSATGGATYNSGTNTVTYTTGAVAANGTASFQLVLAISAAATGTLANTATVTPPSGWTDPDPTDNTSTDTNTLVPTGDLSITKTDGVTTIVPGTSVTYTIVVSNAGPSNVTGAKVNDTLPASISGTTWTATYSTGSTGASSGSGNLSNVLVNLLAGGTATFTVTGLIDAAATGTLSNTATVTAPTGFTDPDTTNNTSTDTSTLTPTGDLAITKTDSATTARPGDTITYTITVTNGGPSTATGATIVDTLPASLLSGSVTSVTAGGAVITSVNHTGGSINDVATIPSGGSITYTVTATINGSATGTLANTATVSGPSGWTDPTPGNNSSTDTNTLVPTGDLSVTKTDGLTSAVPGTTISYTIVVGNSGPSNVTGAKVNDTLPADFRNATWTATYTLGSSGATSGSGSLSNVLVNLLSGGTATFTVTGLIDGSASGTLSNTATVTAPTGWTDPNPNNNTSTDTTSLAPTGDLSINKTDGSATAIPGTNITYTITVSNSGPSNVTGAAVNDTLPAAIRNATWTATYSTGSSGAGSGSGNLSNVLVNLLSGGTAIFTVTGLIDGSASGTLSNTATVTAPTGWTDPNPNNNSSTDTNTLNPTGDLSINKTDGSATAIPGTNITYTITVSNSGPSNVTGAAVNDTLPTAIRNVTWTATYSTGSSGAASGTGNLSNVLVNLLSGGTATFTVTGLIDASQTGSLVNTATVTAPTGWTDPNPNNNSSTDTDTLVPTGDLSIVKTDNSATAIPGTSITYTITVSNAGPSNVFNAAVNDTLPAAIKNATWTATYSTGSSGVANGTGNLSNVLVNLLANGTATFTVTGLIDASATGTLSNTATVTAPSGFTDPTPGNNSSTDNSTLKPTGDLAIVKTDNSATAIPGTNITYTITVSNSGPSNVVGAAINDTLPAAIRNATWTATYSTGSSGAASGSGNISNVLVNLLANGIATFTVTGLIDASATGVLSNTATITPPSDWTDPTPGNNSSTDNSTLKPTGDLAIVKTDNSATAIPGTNITYTITVSNSGPSNVAGAAINDTLPAAIRNATWTATYSTGSSGAASGSGNISNLLVNLLANGTATFTVTGLIDASATGVLSNTATVTPPSDWTDPTPGNNSSTDNSTLKPTGDLAIVKTDNSATAIPGTNITYTITVSNSGPSNVFGAAINDTLPAAIRNATWTATYSNGSSGAASGSGNISNVLVNLLANGTATFTVTGLIDASATGNLSNTATVTPPSDWTDPTPGNNSSTDNSTLKPTGDLAIVKTDNSATAIPGTNITYTITVSNSGPSNVVGAAINDTLPAAIRNATWTATYSAGSSGTASGSGNISNVLVNLLANGTATFTITGLIDASATGVLSNTATVTPPSDWTDPTPGNNSSTDNSTLKPTGDLAIVKTDNSATAIPGTNITYTITVSNSGPSNVVGAAINDTLPAAIRNATWTATYSAGSSGAASGSGNISNVAVNLLANGTATFTVTGLIDASARGTLSNTATVTPPSDWTDPTPGNNSSTDNSTLKPTGDLSVFKTDNATTVIPGTSITYKVYVTNSGPSNLVGGAVNDTLPAAIQNATWSVAYSSGSSGSATSGTGNISNVLVNLLAGGTATFTVTGMIDAWATGTLSNTATVTPPSDWTDPDPNNNTSTDTNNLKPTGDLSIVKTDNSATAIPGTNITYTIRVSNSGPSNVAGAAVNDTLPATIRNATWSVVYTSGSSGSATSGTGNISNVLVNLAANGTATFTVTGLIDASATGKLTNTATVTPPAGWTDPTPGNNSSTDENDLKPTGDLAIVKTDNATTAIPGTNITYTIRVSNSGPSNLTGAKVNDTLPAAIKNATWSVVYSSGSSGSATSGTGNISNVLVNLVANGTATFTVTGLVDASATGKLTNTATITPPSGWTDPNPGNESSTDEDDLKPTGDLAIVKTDNATSAIPGTNITYTIRVSNSGPSTVSGAAINDTLPAAIKNTNWSVVYSSGSSGSATSGTGNISNVLVNLIANGTATFTVNGLIDASATGKLTNTATITPPTGWTDPNPGNETSTDEDDLKPTGDLAIVKTNNSTTSVPGTNVTYTIRVSNSGPSTVTGAAIHDTLPAAIQNATWSVVYSSGSSGSATSGTGNISNVLVNLIANGTATFTVTGLIDASATGKLTNTATITPPPGWTDPNPGNESSTDEDDLKPSADLGVVKTGPATGIAGDLITYTITVSNSGPSSAQNASFTDTLPTGVTLVSQSQVSGPAFTLTTNAGSVLGTIATLVPASPAVFRIVVSVPNPVTPGLKITNTVTVTSPTTDPNPNNNSSKVETTLNGSPISGTVFVDRNRNAVMDSGDGRLGGTLLKLVDGQGNTVSTTSSAVDGTYSFIGVRPGTYTVVEAQPAGYAPSTPTNLPVTLPTAGLTNVNFGQTLGALEGSVFFDANNNGIREAGEAGIANEKVTLTGVDINGLPVSQTITTSLEGWYGFENLVAPNANGYTLTEIQPSKFNQGINKAGTAGGTVTGDVISQIQLKPGQVGTGYTFGEVGTVITGTVFLDLDKTTTFTAKDEGLAGIPVVLLNANGVQVGYALTNSDGSYLFGGVTPGNYQIVFTPPGDYTALLPTSRQVTVPTGGLTGQDLPLTNAKNTLAGFAYIDLNNDGVKQPGEPGIEGVTMTLTNAGFTTTTTTGPDGSYILINVPNGTYTLRETQPVGYTQGKTTVGSAGGTSTTPDVVSSIVLGGSLNGTGYNFGELGSQITGKVFNDANGNGTMTPGETGRGGVTLTLRDQTGKLVATTTTSPDGSYTFGSLIPGTYTLTESVPAGQTATSPTSLTLTVPPGGLRDQNFGLSAQSSLSGAVYEDINQNGRRDPGEPGIAGVLVTLTGTSATNLPVNVTALTGADGVFVIPNLAASNPSGYVLTETPPAGYNKGPDSVGTSGGTKNAPGVIGNIVLQNNTAATDYLFGEWSKQGTIAGSVFLDSNQTGRSFNQPPIGGVTLLLRDANGTVIATTKTAADGSYFFKDVPPGTYTIEEQQPAGYGRSPRTPSLIQPAVVPPTGGLVSDKNFGVVLASVAGTVFSDKNNDGIQNPGEPGISGVVLRVYDTGGNLVATTTTDSQGKYQFTNLPAGNYTVVMEQPPMFVSGKETVGTLGGTAGDNRFTLTVPAGANGTGYNFAQLPVADPVGYVFSDLNNNGKRDPGEPGIANVQIRMTGTDIQGNSVNYTRVTDSTGLYVFAFRDAAQLLPLLPGVYNLYETQPAGWFSGKLENGTPPAAVVSEQDDAFIGIDLTNPPFYGSGYNFGELQPSSMGGSVFIDKNNNGVREPGEAGVGGVTIQLAGTDYRGNKVSTSVVTDANGYYSFMGLAPGTYTLTEVQPVNYIPGVTKAGNGLTNNGTASGNKITNIVVGPGQTGTNANFGLKGLAPDQISKRSFLTTTKPATGAKLLPPGSGVTWVNKI